jgi:homoserine O-acetyltransferase/O-succinyltransferase
VSNQPGTVPSEGSAAVSEADSGPGPDSSGGPEADLGPPPRLGHGRLETISIGSFELESGAVLPDVVVAFRHDGRLPGQAPQVLAVHALTGSADAAGDWWEPLIGPGRALDTTQVGVLCANLLGGRYGTTGPTSVDPASGREYGSRFPEVSTRDQARATWRLLDVLGIGELAVATGGSLGGMVALEIGLERPAAVGTVLPMAAPAATGALAMAWNAIQIELIDRLGEDGLGIARQLAMTTYRSEVDFDSRFGRDLEPDGRLSIASYLDYQGRKLIERFDPDTYRILVRAMDLHDIGRGRGGIVEALRALAASGTRLTGLGITGDILYGPAQVRALVQDATEAGVESTYRELVSTKGHDAFLVEWAQLGAILSEALEGVDLTA